jgi:DNA-binding CsgD family transcriptional regulator
VRLALSSHDDIEPAVERWRGRRENEEADHPAVSETWLVLEDDDVPEQWSHRSMQVTVLRLSADEAKRLLSGDHARPTVGSDDEELARLVASGLGVSEIAKQLHLTTRSIYRRLSRLRVAFGVATVGELAATLSRLGY